MTMRDFLDFCKDHMEAEGIENREDFDWLRNKRYQVFQGYLFGKPAPIAKKDKVSVK
ncbi:hypothetical protein [Cytobacillus sp.]|uniref:hypothetical protein n=1 Tax=Cytobacillus sp. TaxID=2675269 RepID=UPI003517EF80